MVGGRRCFCESYLVKQFRHVLDFNELIAGSPLSFAIQRAGLSAISGALFQHLTPFLSTNQ